VRVVDRAASDDMIREQRRIADVNDIAIAGVLIEIGPPDRSTAARLVYNSNGHVDELALLQDSLHGARGLVLTAAHTCADNNFDRLIRFPLRRRGIRYTRHRK